MRAIACCISLVFLWNNSIAAAEPNEALPKQIKLVPGKVTLFADYDEKWPIGSIPVYLINASTNDVNLAAQDGDVFLKLEVEDVQGRWVRAQPHAFSWCGNSYMNPPIVKPGHFLRIEGYQPKEGEKHKIRFSFYHQKLTLSSNVGDGIASSHDMDLASRDAMAVYDGSFEFVTKVALGEIQLKNEMDHMEDLQEVAIDTLAFSDRFDPTASRKVLIEVLKKFPKRKDDVGRAMRVLNGRANSNGAANRNQPNRSKNN